MAKAEGTASLTMGAGGGGDSGAARNGRRGLRWVIGGRRWACISLQERGQNKEPPGQFCSFPVDGFLLPSVDIII